MENNINILDELNKGCCMGVDALKYILDKVNENDFRDLLENQIKEYLSFSNKINQQYKEYTNDEIHETSKMEKVMTWYGIQKDTILDNGISNLSDMLIRGTTMGIIEGRRILNNKKMNKEVQNICSDYVKMQEEYIEKLKKYL
jgi:hypothetical protein